MSGRLLVKQKFAIRVAPSVSAGDTSSFPMTPAAGVLLGCTLLWGCTTLPRTAGTESFPRLPPASYGGSVQAEQILTMTRNGSTNTLQVYVEITPAKILLVGTSALGQRVLSLVYDEHGLRTESGALGAAAGVIEKDSRPSALALGAAAAEQMLIDFRLVAWPLTALQAAVVGTRWRIEEPRSGTRQVWRDGKAYAEIHYADRANAHQSSSWLPAGHRSSSAWAGRVWLVNLEHGYTLDIESKILN